MDEAIDVSKIDSKRIIESKRINQRLKMIEAVAKGWNYEILTDWEANAYNIIGQADAILKEMNKGE